MFSQQAKKNYRTHSDENHTKSFKVEYSLIPEVFQYKLPMTKNGWWVSVPGTRRVRASKKHTVTSIFIHQHIDRTCIYRNTRAEKQTL